MGSNPARVTSRKAKQRKLPWFLRKQRSKRNASKLVLITVRVHPFPSRTRKLSSLVPTILGWKRPGTIGRRQHKHSSIAQPVEHATVNRRVVGSSPTWGARSEQIFCSDFFVIRRRRRRLFSWNEAALAPGQGHSYYNRCAPGGQGGRMQLDRCRLRGRRILFKLP